MVGYAVCARGVVVDEAEVVGRARGALRDFAELVKAGGNGARAAGAVAVGWDGVFGL